MAKTKTPFLSLGAQGSVGESVTAQKRGGQTLLREKPLPTDPYSLPQAYQRWFYRDIAHFWTLLTSTQKQAYATAGARHHLTGFQEYMRSRLSLPLHLIALWYLDYVSGAISPDAVNNAHPLTNFGTTAATGLIAGCRYFDGLNDYLSPALNPDLRGTDFSLEAFIYRTVDSAQNQILAQGGAAPANYEQLFFRVSAANNLDFSFKGDGVSYALPPPFLKDQWAHVCGTYNWTTRDRRLYLNGDLVANNVAAGDYLKADKLYIGRNSTNPDQWWKGNLDHVAIWKRVLDPETIKRHSERRYSL